MTDAEPEFIKHYNERIITANERIITANFDKNNIIKLITIKEDPHPDVSVSQQTTYVENENYSVYLKNRIYIYLIYH